MGEAQLCGGVGVEAAQEAEEGARHLVVSDEEHPEDVVVEAIECLGDVEEG